MMNFIHRINFGFEYGNLVPSSCKILYLKRQSLNLILFVQVLAGQVGAHARASGSQVSM